MIKETESTKTPGQIACEAFNGGPVKFSWGTYPDIEASWEKAAQAVLADSSFMSALVKLDRVACAVIASVDVDAPITVPDRDYTGMTPKDCYEAGIMDGGMAVRQAIRAAIDAALTPNGTNISGG